MVGGRRQMVGYEGCWLFPTSKPSMKEYGHQPGKRAQNQKEQRLKEKPMSLPQRKIKQEEEFEQENQTQAQG